jgi:hypothetical protein
MVVHAMREWPGRQHFLDVGQRFLDVLLLCWHVFLAYVMAVIPAAFALALLIWSQSCTGNHLA